MKAWICGGVAAFGAGLLLGCAPGAPAHPERSEVRLVPGFGSESDGLEEAWRIYARSRIDGPVELEARRGSPDPPGFGEEVFAREVLARAWSELALRNAWRDVYLDELAAVEAEGWIREYTWECLHVLRGIEPRGLDLLSFRDWLEAELPEHRVETRVMARTERDRVVFEVGRMAHAPYRCLRDR